MEDLDKCIAAIFSPTTDNATRQQAQTYCDQARNAPGFWRICFEKFTRSTSIEMCFWCLQYLVPTRSSLETISKLSPAERQELRSTLLFPWLQQHVSDLNPAIANKMALLLVNLLRLGYGDDPASSEWATPFTDLVSFSAASGAHTDFVLRVLLSFDAEVVSEEFTWDARIKAANTALKHRMRRNDNANITRWFLSILVGMQDRQETLRDTFRCVSLFAVWIDASLLANAEFLQKVFAFIKSDSPLGADACDCLAAILKKRMDAQLKLRLLDGLQMPASLDSIWSSPGELSRCKFSEAVARLYNRVGEEFLDSYSALRFPPSKPSVAASAPQQTAERQQMPAIVWPRVEALVQTCIGFLSCEHLPASTAVQIFLGEWTAVAKKALKATDGGHTLQPEQVRPVLERLWASIFDRVPYPPSFQPEQSCDLDGYGEDADEFHTQFLEYRRGLLLLAVRTVYVDEPLVLEVMRHRVVSLGPSPTMQQIEGVATVFHHLGEAVQKPALGPEAPLGQVFDCLQQHSQHPHWMVNLSFLELYVRYGAAACAARSGTSPPLIVTLVGSFLHERGLRSKELRLAKRAPPLLSKFVKANKAGLGAFHEEFYRAMEEILPRSPETLVKEAMPLYEVLGHLGHTFEDNNVKKQYLQIIVTPLVTDLQKARTACPANTAPGALWCAALMEALGSISRPYSKTSAKVTAEEWTAVSAAVFDCLEMQIGMLSVSNNRLRAVVLFFCRRMLEVLGEQFLPKLDQLLPVLYRDADSANLLELTTLCHHVVSMLKGNSAPFVEKWLPVSISQALECFTKMEDTSAEYIRAKAELGIAILLLLKDSATSAPRTVAALLLDGPQSQALMSFALAAASTELRLRAPAVAFWHKLFAFFGSEPSVVSRLPTGELVEALAGCFAAADDELRDAACPRLPVEAAQALRAMAAIAPELAGLASAAVGRLAPEAQAAAQRADAEAQRDADLAAKAAAKSQKKPSPPAQR